MTEDQALPPTATVPVDGRNITITKLKDLQAMHLGRLAAILNSGNVSGEEKMQASVQMLEILHTIVVDDDDREFLAKAEMKGKVELNDLMEFVNAFEDEPAEEKPTAKRTRAPRARK